ncbi:hypothetical protein LOK49_LG14G01456 [Camellia lanceoleosa]|uniref:Uncharacterized protein n=1 Tax=Camellia lanceoleosa TaxID=1840588 RepID=A0ACC0FDJ4_9ERIC|nr:hypothetical protein LOK49_LG14G01456 [Camellia lanceoleosa]
MKLVGWLFIILSAQALSILALELSSTTTRDTKHHIQEQAINGVNGATSLHGGSEDGRGYIHVLKKAKVYMRNAHSGARGAKGSYGGANVVHRPPRSERSAAPPLLKKKSSPFFFMLSTTILCAGFSLVLVFPF